MTCVLAAYFRLLALCLVASAAVCATAAAAVGAGETVGVEERQILVMLRLGPDHFRPGASYDGDYGDGPASSTRRRVALAIARRNRLDLVDAGWPIPLVGVDCFVMRVPSNQAVADAIARVSRDPHVAWSQPMQSFHAQASGAGADPLYRAQPAAVLWHLADLHRIATGRGVTVAVIDSRIDVHHPDLAGQFVADRDFVNGHEVAAEVHGTGVAGIIAAKENNGIGIAGVAPGARLMALRACWQSARPPSTAITLCNTLSLAQALQFAISHDAEIINLSLSGPPDLLLSRLISIAVSRRASVIAAFDPRLPDGGFPASAPGVISVASETIASLPAGVYAAPGDAVPTTQPGGRWFLVNGSSYAAAHVSGLVALVREKRGHEPHVLLVASSPVGGTIDARATLLRLGHSCRSGCQDPALLARNGM